jgi:FixJ family two-component response regulator
MNHSAPTLYVVGEDRTARQALTDLSWSMHIQCRLFDSAEEFLNRYTPSMAGCVLVDSLLKNMKGLELLEALKSRASILPVIFLIGTADVATAVRGMRAGALTMIEKPCQKDALVEAVRWGFQVNAKAREMLAEQADAQRRLESLTPEERQVMNMVIAGRTNVAIARELGSCRRTVERMRSKIFQKMGVTASIQLPAVVWRVEAAHAALHGSWAPHLARTHSATASAAAIPPLAPAY